jgi:hypothetical protein
MCDKEMTCEKNGFVVRFFDKKQKVSIYDMSGDMYACPNCLTKVVVGFGRPYNYNPTDKDNKYDIVVEV